MSRRNAQVPAGEANGLMNSPRDPEIEAEARKANGRTCLLVALENGHAGVAYELLKAGADPSEADDADGTTPLMGSLVGGVRRHPAARPLHQTL